MGLREILTRPIKLGQSSLSWQEPFAYRIRLRGDALFRLLIALGAWLAGSGLMLILFSFSEDPGGIGLALGLGLLPGAYALCSLFFLSSQVSGRVDVSNDKLRRTSTSFGYVFIVSNDEEWEYHATERCVFVPSRNIGQPFSLMLLIGGGDQLPVGVPSKIDLKSVATILRKHGVEVQKKDRLPASLTRGLTATPAVSMAVAGLLLFGVGLGLTPGDDVPQLAQRPPDVPDLPQLAAPTPPPQQVPEEATAPDSAASELDQTETPSGFAVGDSMPSVGPGTREPFSQPRPPVRSGPPGSPSRRIATERTPVAGGEGGFEFETIDPAGRPVVGLRFTKGRWQGEEHLGRLTPLFDRSAEPAEDLVVARQGFALGALHVSSDEFVDGLVLEFHRLTPDGDLDPADSYRSDPIGKVSDEPRRLASQGRPVVGLYGRGGAVLDAVGLVLEATDQSSR